MEHTVKRNNSLSILVEKLSLRLRQLDWLLSNFLYKNETRQGIQKTKNGTKKFLQLQFWDH